jgi:uncharacterized protein (DUF952 family)
MIITHIIKDEEWNNVKSDKLYFPKSLREDGFTHCSSLKQACKVADYIYPKESGIILLVIETDKLDSKVIWEDLYDLNEEYPHIYGPLNLSSIIKVVELNLNKNNKFELPKNILD